MITDIGGRQGEQEERKKKKRDQPLESEPEEKKKTKKRKIRGEYLKKNGVSHQLCYLLLMCR